MPALERLKLTVAYDGRPFSGWQSQPNQNGVQDHLKLAFLALLSEPVKLHGAGRTDSGVHALGQVAHVDVPQHKFNPAKWIPALNAHLPAQIRVIRCQRASTCFHAQYSAVGKMYRYRCGMTRCFIPWRSEDPGTSLKALTSTLFRQPPIASRVLMTSLRLPQIAEKRSRSTTRTIHQIRIRRRKELICLEFEGTASFIGWSECLPEPSCALVPDERTFAGSINS